MSALAWRQSDDASSYSLITGGLDGQLTEWDTASWTAKSTTDSFGGAVWCLAAQPHTNDMGMPPHLETYTPLNFVRRNLVTPIMPAKDLPVGLQLFTGILRQTARPSPLADVQ